MGNLNIPEQIKFSRGSEPAAVESALMDISAERSDTGNEENYCDPVELTLEQRAEIDAELNRASEKLQELALDPELLPESKKVHLYQNKDPEDKEIGGFSDARKTMIGIILPQGVTLKERKAKGAFYHEVSHYITKTTLRADELNGVKELNTGFNRPESNGLCDKGVFEEGLADIFAAFCLEEDIPCVYNAQGPFMLAFINDAAQKFGQSELQTFKDFFKAKVTQDYKYFKVLRDAYGTDFVKALNNVSTFLAAAREIDLIELSKLGNFADRYIDVRCNFYAGNSVTLSGMKGGLKVSEYQGEYRASENAEVG